MSQINVNTIRNRTGGAPSLDKGAVVTGIVTATTGQFAGDVTVGGVLTYEDVTNIDSTGIVTAKGGIRVGNPVSPGIGATIDPNGNAEFAGISTLGGNVRIGSGTPSGKLHIGPIGSGDIVAELTSDSPTFTYRNGSGAWFHAGKHPSQDAFIISDGANTTANERLRVGSAGQIGIGGANYGTSGQVLTSAGSASAPSWAAIPPAGNTVSLVADGAIGAGKPCIITTAGKAAQVGEELVGQNQFDDSQSELTPANTREDFDLSWDAYRNKALFSYVQGTTVKVDVLSYAESYSDNSASVAKVKSVYGGASVDGNTTMAWDPDTNQTIIGYRDSNRFRISYASLDAGSEVTLGTAHEVTDNNATPETLRVVYDTLNNAVICIWHSAAGNAIWARAGTISGDTMTWGTAVQLSGVSTGQGHMDACWDSTHNKVLVAFRHGQSSNHLGGVALSCSGTTLTWGSVVVLAGYASEYIRLAFDPNEGKALVTFKNSGDGNGYAKTFYINSGTTVTSGTDVMFPGATGNTGASWGDNDLKGHASCYDPRAKEFLISGAFTNSSQDTPFGNVIEIDAGNDTLSWKGTTKFYDWGSGNIQDHWSYWGAVSLSNWGKSVFVGRSGATSPAGRARIYSFNTCVATSNLTTANQNFLGFAENAISDGATGDIKLTGNVVGNQSGLTPATWYSVQANGTLSSGGSASSAGGLAVASDKLRIKDVPKS